MLQLAGEVSLSGPQALQEVRDMLELWNPSVHRAASVRRLKLVPCVSFVVDRKTDHQEAQPSPRTLKGIEARTIKVGKPGFLAYFNW